MTKNRGVASARPASELRVGEYARVDTGRTARTGSPEIIWAEGKTSGQLVGLLTALHSAGAGALVSRPSRLQRSRLAAVAKTGLPLEELAGGMIVRLQGPLDSTNIRGRPAAILTAGTADVRFAEEARAVLESLGASTVSAYDVGVAGLHRLLRALRTIERRRPGVYLVFAGREGALPSVVAGLVPAPVLGIPTSSGYGRGGRGEAALNAMLQSCAPLAILNVDAAVPAALVAARILALSAGNSPSGMRNQVPEVRSNARPLRGPPRESVR